MEAMELFAHLKALTKSAVLLAQGHSFQQLTGVNPKVVLRPGHI